MTLSKGVLAEFSYNRVFIETGAYEGDGIQQALKAGFEEIYSIEISEKQFTHCQERFKKESKVNVIYGDSKVVLPGLLERISDSVTFWLDAHKGQVDKLGGCPLLEELKIISNFHVKENVILIDDRRLFCAPKGSWGVKYTSILKILREINPACKISFRTGHVPEDIIVAEMGFKEK